jgi:hypothetical protein
VVLVLVCCFVVLLFFFLFPSLIFSWFSLETGEAYLSLALEQMQHGFYSRTAESLDKAVSMLEQCTQLDGSIVCVWKLLGDAYTQYYQLTPSLANKDTRKNVCK